MARLFQILGNKEVKKNNCQRSRGFRIRVESLEDRQMLSAAPLSAFQATAADQASALVSTVAPAVTATPFIPRYSPAELRGAYGFNKLTNDGTGQTVAIVVGYKVFDETGAGAAGKTLQNDLDTFSTAFGLPKTTITVAPSISTQTATDPTPVWWTEEAAMDLEYVHAMAPGAKIVLVQAYEATAISITAAANQAANIPGVSVVSMSLAGPEFQNENWQDSNFTTPQGHTPVAFVAASGDNGTVTYPSASPNVLADGGTELGAAAGSGAYGLEIAWGGSGGGVSQEAAPAFQTSFSGSTHRTTPDVAFDAEPDTGVKVFCSAAGGWTTGCGTSLGTPCWAGLIADADQARAADGHKTLGTVVQDIYSLPAADFHDIIGGSNLNNAIAGYDKVTGRGTPKADLIVADLRWAELPPTNVSLGSVLGNTPKAPAPVTTPPSNPTHASVATSTVAKAAKPAMPTADMSFAAVDAAFAEMFEVAATTGKQTPANQRRQ